MNPKTLNIRMPIVSSALVLALLANPTWGQTDIVLSETWVPGSHEVINCRGGTIRPAVPASVDNGVAIPSMPDTLIYLKDVTGVKIRNCVLEDATFGIFAVGGGNHSIGDNLIDAASTAVGLLASNYNSVTNNSLTATVSSVAVSNGATANLILGNELTFKPGPDQRFAPGVPVLAGYQYQLITGSNPIGGVVNIIVNGELKQVPATVDNFAENTLVLQNVVNNDGGTIGIGFAVRSLGSKATDNTVSGGFVGLLAAGYQDGFPGPFTLPGTCSANVGRYCATDADCNLPEFDLVPLGTCEGATELLSESRRVIAPEFVNNTVSEAFIGIDSLWTEDFRIAENDFKNNCVGIELIGYSLEKGEVTGNIVASNAQCGFPVGPNIGLALVDLFTQSAAVDVSYNDFGGSTIPFDAFQFDPIIGFGPYVLPTELPNNWWGVDCSDDGFPDSFLWPNTSDPTPFAEPVAEAYRINENKTRRKDRCW